MQISQEVLTVLSTLEVEGLEVRITEQLDRKLYVRVNEVLAALGGTWSRKAKAHVFDVEPRDRLDEVMTTGEVTTAADLCYFPTPPKLAMELCRRANVGPGDTVLEPSAGDGCIVLAALECHASYVWACEWDMGRRNMLRTQFPARFQLYDEAEFLNVKPGRIFDRVVMNPPFRRVGLGDHLAHVAHAMKFLDASGTLVSVLPASVRFRQDARHLAFRDWVFKHGGTLEPLPTGSFKPATGVNTVVLTMPGALL